MYFAVEEGHGVEVSDGSALASLTNSNLYAAAGGDCLSGCELISDRAVRMVCGGTEGAEIVIVHDAEDDTINGEVESGTFCLAFLQELLNIVEGVGGPYFWTVDEAKAVEEVELMPGVAERGARELNLIADSVVDIGIPGDEVEHGEIDSVGHGLVAESGSCCAAIGVTSGKKVEVALAADNFATDLDTAREGVGGTRFAELLGDGGDAEGVGGDVLPYPTIATSGSADELAILIDERARNAVVLPHGYELVTASVVVAGEGVHALVGLSDPRSNLLDVLSLLTGEHRGAVSDTAIAIEVGAYLLCGAVRKNEVGVLLLELLDLSDESIKVGIADDWSGCDVVHVGVIVGAANGVDII